MIPDINKLKRGMLIAVPYNNRYWVATIIGISKKHNCVSVAIGDYMDIYNIPIDDCREG